MANASIINMNMKVFGSTDIKAQLPAEWSKFKSVDGEFITLMRRISNHPFAMEALNIDNLQRTLERLSHLMTVIQKALGSYLEKQRSDFSRFYFLGGELVLTHCLIIDDCSFNSPAIFHAISSIN